MPKNLLLCGPSGCGKSTMLLKKLYPYFSNAAGFATLRLKDKNGITQAFKHIQLSEYIMTEADYVTNSDSCFIDFQKNIRSEEELRKQIPELNDSSSWIFMDEIGGFELRNKVVCDSYLKLFTSEKPCIGVLKWIGSDSHLRLKPEKAAAVEQWDNFYQEILKTDTLIVHFDSDTEQILNEWIRQNISG